MLEFAKKVYRRLMGSNKNSFPGSRNYWEERYRTGGNSGPGSYNNLALFKAKFLNDFVKENNISTVIEFGCGDGNQVSLGEYPQYAGLDVSVSAIQLCKKRFSEDKTKSFFLYNSLSFVDNAGFFKSEVTISLDVIYHLIEDTIFEMYMNHLFAAATKFVIIYSSDYDSSQVFHEKNRKFSSWVENNIPSWKLIKIVKNEFPEDIANPDGTSKADFYIYAK